MSKFRKIVEENLQIFKFMIRKESQIKNTKLFKSNILILKSIFFLKFQIFLA